MSSGEETPLDVRQATDLVAPRAQPYSDWVCGYAQLGKCCSQGPTADGRCSRIHKSQASGEETLPPCIPRRGHRWRREALKVNLAIMVGGLLLLALALPTREATFVPGELSSKHAQILNNTVVSQRCSSCHPTVHDELPVSDGDTESRSSWFNSAALDVAHRLIENDGHQDRLCIQCHQSHMPAAAARLPHDLTAQQWRQLSEDPNSQVWKLVSTTSSTDASDAETQAHLQSTSCAQCHIEHNGRQFDIKRMSDARCQACHRKQFESLSSGHPQFTNFPVDRPRRLMFSHANHQTEHFAKKNREFDCKSCHLAQEESGPYGKVTRSLSFETACASCHDGPIRAASTEGWTLLQVPSLDKATIDSAADLANWPRKARYGIDGEVSPVMTALLMADDEIVASLPLIPASGKLVDISTNADRRAQIARQVASATKRLIDETARHGQAAWTGRLEKVTQRRLGRELTPSDQALIERMVNGLPPDLFRSIQAAWFDPNNAVQQNVMLVRTPDASTTDQPGRPDKQPSSADLLSEELAPSESLQDSGDSLLLPDSFTLPQVEQANSSDNPWAAPIKGATHVRGGGWYIDESTLTIRVFLTGHADPLQSAWVQWWSLIEPANSRVDTVALSAMSAQITPGPRSPASHVARIPGGCTQCHQLSNGLADASAYRIVQRSRAEKEFTKFNHTPHLALPAVSDCRFCHEMLPGKGSGSKQPSAERLVSLPDLNRHPQTDSEFSSMKLQQCAACHRPGGANDGCLQCHHYHINQSFDLSAASEKPVR